MKDKIYETLFKISENWYRKLFKKKAQAWNITIEKLEKKENGKLGKEYYKFLNTNGFSILPKLESHDIFHVITGTGTKVKDEISMQFYLFANGKRSVYQALVICSSIFYIEHYNFFFQQYKKGKQALPFHHLDYKNLLDTDLKELITNYNITR